MPTTIPEGTSLNLASSVVPEQVAADESAARPQQLLAHANNYAERSTQFVLPAVLFVLVLFFASVATKFAEPKVQAMPAIVSLLLLVFCLMSVALLPTLWL